jgi:asparagine synthase (glutamine-hydrolysing)
MKYRSGVGKYVLREAVKDILPAEILARPKQGFGTPMAEWLRGPFGEHAHATIRRSSLVERGAIRATPIDRIFAAHRSGRADWSYHLWNVYNVCAWHDRWVTGRDTDPEPVTGPATSR